MGVFLYLKIVGGFIMRINAPRGTVDLLPEQTRKWQYVERVIQDLCERFQYKEIRTPMFEHTEVFQRSVGDTTDIVQKEMYTFEDRGNRSITLRPEGTAGVVRAFVQNKMHGEVIQPVKLYYFDELFRYERPQQGRMRQLHQFGVEALGSDDPAIDAEVIGLAMACYEALGLTSLKLVINSLGDQESRQAHKDALIAHFTPVKDELCGDCQTRLEQNPLRVLDCKKDMDHEAMKTAPSILEYLNEESGAYFTRVKEYLDEMGISYVVDETLVRGLDYYNHTAFEIMSDADGFGAITTLLGGGRYNGLAEQLGGPSTPGIGFGMGLERLLMALEAEKVELPIANDLDLFFITMGEETKATAVKLVQQLRLAGIRVDQDYQNRKVKAQFKAADRVKANYVAVLGEEELAQGKVKIRSMETGDEVEVAFDDLVKTMQEKCGGIDK